MLNVMGNARWLCCMAAVWIIIDRQGQKGGNAKNKAKATNNRALITPDPVFTLFPQLYSLFKIHLCC
jgi:hypothetical protein